MNLDAVQAKDQFDVPMHEIIGSDIKKLEADKDGIKLWKKFNAYRKFIVETTGSYKEGDNAKWVVKVKDINTFKDNTDLTAQINKMFNAPGNKVNKEDLAALASIYEELTKKELNDHHEQKNIHWIAKTFDHSPLVAAIASLSSLENDILAARAKAVNLLKSKVTTGEYSFNKIQELVSGPGVATAGEPIELKVTMAAYDSDNNPVVTGPGSITIENGIGTVKTTAANNGEMNLSGTVTIYNKAGVPKQRPWSWKVQIVQPNGSIALPELSIMYTGWQNKVVPVAAGVVSSSISVSGGSATPATWSDANGNYKGYYVNVAQGTKQVSITLSGKDKDGKSRSFGTFRYKVKPFPNAQVSGSTISKSTGFIANVSLGADSPFTGIAFNVIGGTIDDVPFSGKAIPGSAVSKVRVGKKVAIEIFYTRNGVRSAVPAQGILKVTN
jgi:gliding motility-associated protein GldM